ncbi:MAG: hypothetical protein ABI353_10215 [Isosphaeraceae bacterium]
MMVSCALTLWMAAVLAQAGALAPAEAAWLKAVPAEAEVVVRGRTLKSIHGDLDQMLKAMSPNLSEMAKPVVDAGVDQLANQFGQDALKTPFLFMMRLPKVEDAQAAAPGTWPAFAGLVRSADLAGVQKALAGGDPKAKPQPGGYDQFTNADGQTLYSAKLSSGFVVFGSDKDLVAATVKPTAALDARLNDDLRNALLGGDLGVYVNLKAVQARYGDQLNQAREQALGGIDRGAAAQGNAGSTESAKAAVSRLFETLKKGEALAFHLDFAAEGLTVAGQTLGSAAKEQPPAPAGTAALMTRLPANAAIFSYMKLSPEAMQRFQRLGMSMLGGQAGKTSPALEKALALQRQTGPQEIASSVEMSQGIQSFSLVVPQDPKAYVDSMAATLTALKSADNAKNIIKDVKVQNVVEPYKGFQFHKATMTFDMDAIAKQQPNNPGGADAVKQVLGGTDLTTWYGTDGKQVLSVSAKDWNTAKTQIDAALSGTGTLGAMPGYKVIRAKLPEQVNALILVSMQGVVRQLAAQVSARTPGSTVRVPADMPKDPALLGGAITRTQTGSQFQFIVPSAVGSVVERGLMPVISSMAAQVAK